jgi:RNA polymerase sigma-70 factor, ECF subfamily
LLSVHSDAIRLMLALMLLHDARKAARLRDGQVVPLDDQDRTLWDGRQIDEGRAVLQRANGP